MMSDSSYWLVAGTLYTYRKTANPEGWQSSPRTGKTRKYEYGFVLQPLKFTYPKAQKTPSVECFDCDNIAVNRLPVRWSFPWVWSGCVRRTLVPSGLCSIQWKDLHKQATLSYNWFILSIIPRTKGQYHFICLRQRKVTNKQLESPKKPSNKFPVVFFFSTHCGPPAKTRIFFSRHRHCAERTQTWNRSSLLLPAIPATDVRNIPETGILNNNVNSGW